MVTGFSETENSHDGHDAINLNQTSSAHEKFHIVQIIPANF